MAAVSSNHAPLGTAFRDVSLASSHSGSARSHRCCHHSRSGITEPANCADRPGVLLSATGPLMQRWFHAALPRHSPYTLYALSNLGSLSALLAYPFVFEPLISRSQQSWAWSFGFITFIEICAWCGRKTHFTLSPPKSASDSNTPTPSPIESITWSQRILWLTGAAIGTGLLAGITVRISADVAPVPFLWIAPISIYLLSFVVTFSTRSCYRPTLFAGLLMLAAAVMLDLRSFGSRTDFDQFLFTALFALAVACIICHGELYRARPNAQKLTDFYLTISGGGLWERCGSR